MEPTGDIQSSFPFLLFIKIFIQNLLRQVFVPEARGPQ